MILWIIEYNEIYDHQHLSNLKKRARRKGSILVVLFLDREIHESDPNAYRYKWSNGSKISGTFGHFISEQKRPFSFSSSVRSINVLINIRLIGLRLSTKKDLSKSLPFFLSKLLLFLSKFLLFLSNSLPFFFVSFGNTPFIGPKIHIYELKGPNDQLCNQLLES